jgi:hypothetical protein
MSVKIRKFILVLVAGKQILGLMHEFREARASGSPEFVERVMSGWCEEKSINRKDLVWESCDGPLR